MKKEDKIAKLAHDLLVELEPLNTKDGSELAWLVSQLYDKAKKMDFKKELAKSRLNNLAEEMWSKMGDLEVSTEDWALTNRKYLEEINEPDLLLGLAGVEEGALERAEERKRYASVLKEMDQKIQDDRKKAIKNAIFRRVSRT